MKNPLSLLPLIEPILESTGVDYAVGGGVAMAAHGYVRETEDLDVFFLHTDRAKVLHALRKAKIHFASIMDPYQYAIIPSAKNLNHRIDLLFTSDDLEAGAVEYPENIEVEAPNGKRIPLHVFPVSILAACKVSSNRDKDHSDVRRMYEQGLFDYDEVLKTLRASGEPGAKKRLNKVLENR